MSDFEFPFLTAKQALTAQSQGARLVDIRKPYAREQDGKSVSDSLLRDPFTFTPADPVFGATGLLAFYCVHGHEVSQFATGMALVHGHEAAYVRGGYEALVAAGANLTDLIEMTIEQEDGAE